MLLRELDYARPESVEEAVQLLAAREDARTLAGGQSLVNVMKTRVASPDLVVDLNRIDALERTVHPGPGHRPQLPVVRDGAGAHGHGGHGHEHGANGHQHGHQAGLPVGDPVPALVLPDLDGGLVELAAPRAVRAAAPHGTSGAHSATFVPGLARSARPVMPFGLPGATAMTKVLRANTFGAPLPSPALVTVAIVAGDAAANTSAGAPLTICWASVELPP